ncbi:MAG: DNA polymerase III subunit gamma/tau C-terminal domain-containing protein, partial [Oceanisphaera sp.]|nr:DNA polymerase III subunit gamma/tau C-terminal domain-containing protein [Oceanisphaera sp.]
DEILNEAGRLGHASQPQLQPQEQNSTPQVAAADDAALPSPKPAPMASNSVVPVAEAQTTAAASSTEPFPVSVDTSQVTQNVAPVAPAPVPAVDAVVDEAAADVARIRRLLQTRNRLRSQEPEKAVSASEQPAARALSAVPPVRAAAPVTPAPTPPARADTTPIGAGPSVHAADSAAERNTQSGADELPPLDAYDDMPWDDDDTPPWQDEPAASRSTTAATVKPPPPVSKPASALPQSTITPGAAASTQNPPAADIPRPGSSRIRATAASSLPGPDPLKAASLLPLAEDEWTRLVAQLPLGGLLRQLAMHSTLERDDRQWRLWLRPAHRHLLTDKTRQELEAAINGQQPAPVSLQVDIGEQGGETPFEIEQLLYQAATARAKDEIEADDAVQFLISRFAAVLDTDSIEPMAQ